VNAKDVLVKAGASEGLISAIKSGQEKRLNEVHRLMKEYYETPNEFGVDRLQKRIAVGKELRDRLGDTELLVGEEREWGVLVEYFKTNLPKMEATYNRRTLQPQPDH
jgi:hypothetical protein